MKKVLLVLITGLLLGALAASHAKLPAAPPMSDADKAAKAEKDAAAKAKEAADLGKAQDKAVANYKKNKGVSMDVKKKK
jgi:2C-methyl-D-erythritol 2,4-cyclodiphosphate synthase